MKFIRTTTWFYRMIISITIQFKKYSKSKKKKKKKQFHNSLKMPTNFLKKHSQNFSRKFFLRKQFWSIIFHNVQKIEIGFKKIVFIQPSLNYWKYIRMLTYADSIRNDLKLVTQKYRHQVTAFNVKVLCHGHCRFRTSKGFNKYLIQNDPYDSALQIWRISRRAIGHNFQASFMPRQNFTIEIDFYTSAKKCVSAYWPACN